MTSSYSPEPHLFPGVPSVTASPLENAGSCVGGSVDSGHFGGGRPEATDWRRESNSSRQIPVKLKSSHGSRWWCKH